MKNIGIKEAKAKFSQTLEAAEDSPVLITHHGKPRSVVMSFEHYQKLQQPRSMWEALRSHRTGEFELERVPMTQRDIDL